MKTSSQCIWRTTIKHDKILLRLRNVTSHESHGRHKGDISECDNSQITLASFTCSIRTLRLIVYIYNTFLLILPLHEMRLKKYIGFNWNHSDIYNYNYKYKNDLWSTLRQCQSRTGYAFNISNIAWNFDHMAVLTTSIRWVTAGCNG